MVVGRNLIEFLLFPELMAFHQILDDFPVDVLSIVFEYGFDVLDMFELHGDKNGYTPHFVDMKSIMVNAGLGSSMETVFACTTNKIVSFCMRNKGRYGYSYLMLYAHILLVVQLGSNKIPKYVIDAVFDMIYRIDSLRPREWLSYACDRSNIIPTSKESFIPYERFVAPYKNIVYPILEFKDDMSVSISFDTMDLYDAIAYPYQIDGLIYTGIIMDNSEMVEYLLGKITKIPRGGTYLGADIIAAVMGMERIRTNYAYVNKYISILAKNPPHMFLTDLYREISQEYPLAYNMLIRHASSIRSIEDITDDLYGIGIDAFVMFLDDPMPEVAIDTMRYARNMLSRYMDIVWEGEDLDENDANLFHKLIVAILAYARKRSIDIIHAIHFDDEEMLFIREQFPNVMGLINSACE